MSEIVLRNVCKMYEKGQYAVRDFSLKIGDGEFIIFVGPSGCGKSTTLRMIAGLEDISEGELWIDGQLCNYVEPKERELSMVFQNYALYPHMSIYDNLAFSLSVRKEDKKVIDTKVHQVAAMLGIEHLLNQKPKNLSGGQKQRVAIGSALVRDAKAYLMDEPLSNLDAKLRTQMRVELATIHKKLGATIVYVTHDQTEAMTLGTKIVVMKDGLIQQADTPAEVYENPANLFVAGFIGSPSMNFFRGEIGSHYDETFFHMEGGRSMKLTGERAGVLGIRYLGSDVVLGVRPEDFYAEPTAEDAANPEKAWAIEGKIVAREMLGSEVMLYLDNSSGSYAARLPVGVSGEPGERKILYIDRERAHYFDAQTEENIFYYGGQR